MMKIFGGVIWSILFFLVLFPAPAPAQSGSEKSDDQPSLSVLIEQLGADDFDQREAAFKALQAKGEESRPLLKKALDHEDAEIRWRAARLLALLDGPGAAVDDEGGLNADDWMRRGQGEVPLLMDRLQKLEERLQRRFDQDFALPDLDDLHSSIQELLRGPMGRSPFSGWLDPFERSPFGKMETLMDSLRNSQGDLTLEMDGSKAHYRMLQKDGEREEELKLDLLPGGAVKAQVVETDEEGNRREKLYEADSLEAFRKEFPEVADRFKIEGLHLGKPGWRIGDPPSSWNLRDELPRRKTLGIYLDPEGPDRVLRSQMGLDEEIGVIVEKVLPGSFAEKIGLKPMDVLIAVNDQEVGGPAMIREALSRVDEGDEVSVTLIREGEKMTLKGSFVPEAKKI